VRWKKEHNLRFLFHNKTDKFIKNFKEYQLLRLNFADSAIRLRIYTYAFGWPNREK
jgi:hypothetical protein